MQNLLNIICFYPTIPYECSAINMSAWHSWPTTKEADTNPAVFTSVSSTLKNYLRHFYSSKHNNGRKRQRQPLVVLSL